MSDFNEIWIFSEDKKTHIKFHENPSRESWVFPCGQKGKAKLKVTFRLKIAAATSFSIILIFYWYDIYS